MDYAELNDALFYLAVEKGMRYVISIDFDSNRISYLDYDYFRHDEEIPKGKLIEMELEDENEEGDGDE